MACGADVARGARADATWHARPRCKAVRAHVAGRWRRGGADAWQGHASPRRCPSGATWQERVTGLASEGPTGWWALVIVLGR